MLRKAVSNVHKCAFFVGYIWRTIKPHYYWYTIHILSPTHYR